VQWQAPLILKRLKQKNGRIAWSQEFGSNVGAGIEQHGEATFLFFFFFFWYWSFELRVYTLSTPSPFCDDFFWDRVSWTIYPGWLWTSILLMSASWEARITGVNPCLRFFSNWDYRQEPPALARPYLFKKNLSRPSMVAHNCNPRIQEAEARGSWVQGQPGLHREILSKKKKIEVAHGGSCLQSHHLGRKTWRSRPTWAT
jgi:hypothetical protein